MTLRGVCVKPYWKLRQDMVYATNFMAHLVLKARSTAGPGTPREGSLRRPSLVLTFDFLGCFLFFGQYN